MLPSLMIVKRLKTHFRLYQVMHVDLWVALYEIMAKWMWSNKTKKFASRNRNSNARIIFKTAAKFESYFQTLQMDVRYDKDMALITIYNCRLFRYHLRWHRRRRSQQLVTLQDMG